jgi:hypothetical protein
MSAEVIQLKLPRGALVKGALYNTYDLDYLSEDLLEIDLRNGLTIDVGWYPEGERPGTFQVVLFQDHWRNHVIEPIETTSLARLVPIVEAVAKKYSGDLNGYSISAGDPVDVNSEATELGIEPLGKSFAQSAAHLVQNPPLQAAPIILGAKKESSALDEYVATPNKWKLGLESHAN